MGAPVSGAEPATEGVFRVLGTHHVAIHTPDLARLRAFYVDTLGLPVVGGFPEHGILFVAAGGTLVELIEERAGDGDENPDVAAVAGATRHGGLSDAPGRGRRYGWNHLAWTVADVDAAYAALGARGVALRSAPESFPPEAPGFRIAFVADPDGNLLELIQPLPAGRSDSSARRRPSGRWRETG
jgi:lactoylglutathione lyase